MAYKQVTFEKTETVDIAVDKGQVSEGIYLRRRGIPFGAKEDGTPDVRTIVDMQGPNGDKDLWSFWAPTAVENSLPQIPSGAKIRLTYLGKQKNPKTGRTFKAFTIEVDTDGDDRSPLDRIPA